MFGDDAELARLVSLHSKAIDCLATGAVPNIKWCDGVRDHALNILTLVDEMQERMSPKSATEVN